MSVVNIKMLSLEVILALCLVMAFNSPGCESIKDVGHLKNNPVVKGVPGEGLSSDARAAYFFSSSQLKLYDGRINDALEDIEKSTEADPNSAFLYLKHAEILMQDGNMDAALQKAEKAKQLEPENIDVHLFLADIYIFIHRPDQAEKTLLQALEIEPENEKASLKLSEAYMAQGLAGPCVVNLREYLERHPDSLEARFRLAQTLARLERWQEAEAQYKRILDTRPGFYPALMEMGRMYVLSGWHHKAVETYKLLLGYYPEDVHTRSLLANILMEKDENEEALQILAAGKRVSPEYPDWWLLSGYIYMKDDDLEKAEREYRELYDLQPGNGDAAFYLGLVAQLSDRKQEAMAWFEKVPRDAGGYLEGVHRLAWLYVDAERYGDARKLLEKAIELKKKSPLLYIDLSGVYQQEENWEKAEAALRDGLESNPDNFDLLYHLGVIYELSGRRKKSLAQMQELIERDADNPKVLNFIGYTWIEEGVNLDQAEDYINRALEKDPESGFIMDSLGWLYYVRGDYEKALEWLIKAEEKMPGDPEITTHLGDTYLRLNNKEKALEYYQKALDGKPRRSLDQKIRAKVKELQ